MPEKKLVHFLDDQHVKYIVLTHSPAFTAQEIAASAHVPGKDLAKAVVVKMDTEVAMAVLPASKRIDLGQFQHAVGAKKVRLAEESEFAEKFPGCEVGAMPPFGNLFGLQTFVDQSLAEDEEIVFNAGNHTELMRVSFSDYERVAKPVRLQFAEN